MTQLTIRLAVVTLVLAASATFAYAQEITLLDCYLVVNGEDAPQKLTLDDQFGERSKVKLGKPRLLCTQATGTVESGELRPGDFTEADHVICYDTPARGSVNVKKQISTPLTSGTVKVLVPVFTCVLGFKCDLGENCPPE